MMLAFVVQLVVARGERVGRLFLQAYNKLNPAGYTITGPTGRRSNEVPDDGSEAQDFVEMVVVTRTPLEVY